MDSVVTGGLIVDSANWGYMRQELEVFIDFGWLTDSVEEAFNRLTGDQMVLLEKILVCPPVDHHHANIDGILKFRDSMQRLGWRIEEPPTATRCCPNCQSQLPKGEDDQVLMTVLVEEAAKYDVVVIGTGDGGFVRLLQGLKLVKPQLKTVVVSTTYGGPSFRSSHILRERADIFMEITQFSCCSRNRYSTRQTPYAERREQAMSYAA